jgi:hypothetical protein
MERIQCHCQADKFVLHIYLKISKKLLIHYNLNSFTPPPPLITQRGMTSFLPSLLAFLLPVWQAEAVLAKEPIQTTAFSIHPSRPKKSPETFSLCYV